MMTCLVHVYRESRMPVVRDILWVHMLHTWFLVNRNILWVHTLHTWLLVNRNSFSVHMLHTRFLVNRDILWVHMRCSTPDFRWTETSFGSTCSTLDCWWTETSFGSAYSTLEFWWTETFNGSTFNFWCTETSFGSMNATHWHLPSISTKVTSDQTSLASTLICHLLPETSYCLHTFHESHWQYFLGKSFIICFCVLWEFFLMMDLRALCVKCFKYTKTLCYLMNSIAVY